MNLNESRLTRLLPCSTWFNPSISAGTVLLSCSKVSYFFTTSGRGGQRAHARVIVHPERKEIIPAENSEARPSNQDRAEHPMPMTRYEVCDNVAALVTRQEMGTYKFDMRPNPERNRRRSLRLPGYDYSVSGAYFVTVCTRNKVCLFADIVDWEKDLNGAGQIIRAVWDELPKRYANIDLDLFVVMPNHVHGIVVLTGTSVVGAGLALPDRKGSASSAPTFGDVIRGFKSISAIQVNRLLMRTGQPLWQRNYYEHIIRDENSLERIREYIAANPHNWLMDRENPASRAVANDFEKELGYGR